MLTAMAQQQNDGAQNPFANMPGMTAVPPAPPAPKTRLQKLMPLVHLVAAWLLFAYFVLWKEPEVYDARTHGSSSVEGRWRRWAELGWKAPVDGWSVQAVVSFTLHV